MSSVWVPLLFFIAVVAIASATQLNSRFFRHRLFTLFKVFIPSWRFFDELGPELKLFYRAGASPDALSAWAPVTLPAHSAHRRGPGCAPRGWTALFLNPWENLELAGNSLVLQLVQDLGQGFGQETRSGEVQELTSYLLLDRWVGWQLPSEGSMSYYQFKVCEVQAGIPEDVLLSPLKNRMPTQMQTRVRP